MCLVFTATLILRLPIAALVVLVATAAGVAAYAGRISSPDHGPQAAARNDSWNNRWRPASAGRQSPGRAPTPDDHDV